MSIEILYDVAFPALFLDAISLFFFEFNINK